MEKEMRIGGKQGWIFARDGVKELSDRIKRTTKELEEQDSAQPFNRRKQFPTLRKPVEEIVADLEALDDEEERLELEKELDTRLVAFREMYVAWMQRDITLDDMLTAMMASGLCNRLTPFR